MWNKLFMIAEVYEMDILCFTKAFLLLCSVETHLEAEELGKCLLALWSKQWFLLSYLPIILPHLYYLE
jgi:hypothetical protein